MSNIKDLLIDQEELFDEPELTTKVNIKDTSSSEHKKNTQISKERGVRKYMKYEDGEIMYLDESNSEGEVEVKGEVKDKDNVNSEKKSNLNFKSKFLNFFNKEKFNKLLEITEKDFNFKYFINTMIVIFVIIFILFVYAYYLKGNNTDKYIANNSENIVAALNTEEIFNIENKTEENVQVIDKNIKLEDIINEIKKINSEEIGKINDYIDLKANRASTISAIKRYKTNKENLYVLISKNQNLIKEGDELLQETVDLLVKSIAMSNEFLNAFHDKSTKTKLNDIIEKYY